MCKSGSDTWLTSSDCGFCLLLYALQFFVERDMMMLVKVIEIAPYCEVLCTSG